MNDYNLGREIMSKGTKQGLILIAHILKITEKKTENFKLKIAIKFGVP